MAPQIQGAGVHHNPTPGPAGSKFLYGQSWVVLNRIVRHEHFGTIGRPHMGRLYIRDKDVPKLPAAINWEFRTQPQWAAELITWAGSLIAGPAQRPWAVVDGAYANQREFLQAGHEGRGHGRRPAAAGCQIVRPAAGAQARSEARAGPPADLRQEPAQPGQAGRSAAGLADGRCGDHDGPSGDQDGGKTFLATWHPAGGPVRVVIVKESDGSWRAYLCTAPEADVVEIVQATLDRWAIEQTPTT